ncbi:MAG: DUF4394 domain-containing protein [Blastocatellia bacterium]|nr:DUF4394 domain-containing protein [Blastocatellia bacterium]
MKISKKTFIGTTLMGLAFVAAISMLALTGGSRSVKAAGYFSGTGLNLPNSRIYFLTSDNMIYQLVPGTSIYAALGTVRNLNGNLIGIDFRPANGMLYGLTDTGRLYTISTGAPPSATLVSTLSSPFDAGFQSLFDFNPVQDAIRISGSNTQNFAVTKNANGVLNTTTVQTSLTYAAGDVNAGKTPVVVGGAYNNNVAGAATTIFYAIDAARDTFLTIADKNATGSSNTGGGRLQTIGNLVDSGGNRLNFNHLSDIDIYTTTGGVNTVIGINNKTLFTIDMNQINPNLKLGQTQNVVVKSATLNAFPDLDSAIDIAVVPAAGQSASR